MEKWKVVDINNGFGKATIFSESDKFSEKKVVGSVSEKSTFIKKIAIVSGVAISGGVSPVYELHTISQNPTIVANYTPDKEFEMERPIVYKDLYEANQKTINDKIDAMNSKIDKLSSVINNFIDNEALTRTNVWSSLTKGLFSKAMMAIGVITTIWKFIELIKSALTP